MSTRQRQRATPRDPAPDDAGVDAALRRAFAGLDAPPRLDLSDTAPASRAQRPISVGLVVAATGAFLACALLPSILVRWDLAARIWVTVAPWAVRGAPVLGLLSWLWLEHAPWTWVRSAESG